MSYPFWFWAVLSLHIQTFHFTAASQAVMEGNAPSLRRESKYEMSWLHW